MKPLSRRLLPPASLQIYSVIFVIILFLHARLLRLPFFWDEAGFYVPAAYDLVHTHSLIPQTTLDTAHPPLPAAYLGLWFSLSGWKPAVARIAMLLVAAFALTNVFLLARRLAGTGVAVASTVATAVYPIWFVQSSLTHADLLAAALTLWGIRCAVEKRVGIAQIAFSLAVLAKETSFITPLAFAVWELIGRREDSGTLKARIGRSAVWLIPALPLAAWLIYHHYATGRFLGGAEFYKYNVAQAMTPVRFLLALLLRLWHLLGIMNMLALTGAMAVAMRFPPVVDRTGERKRIAIPVQLQFALVMLAHLITFSLLGGALLTRYLLPVYPLVIIISMSTLHRRILRWEWPAAVIVIFFVLALFFDPPYRFAPEDNLTYRDFVRLHVAAAHFLEQHDREATVVTAWPAKDELTKPYLGYVARPFQVESLENFTVEELWRGRQLRGRYQAALLFSTKYEGGTWFRSELWNRLNQKFFDYHQDVPPDAAAEILGGRIVFLARERAEWVAVVEMEQGSRVALNDPSAQHTAGHDLQSRTVPDIGRQQKQ
jgi:hypothetical protein